MRKGVRKIQRGWRGNRGYASASKAGGRAGFESTLERDYYVLLQFDPAVASFTPQPVKIFYKNANGRKTSYVPDTLVEYTDGRLPTLVDIKYAEELKKDPDVFRVRFQAAREYARSEGWTFYTATEKVIRGQRLTNCSFLRQYLDPTRSFDPAIQAELLSRTSAHPPLLQDLLLGLSLQQKGEWLPVLWHLVATSQINVDLNKPLTLTSSLFTIPAGDEL